MKTPSHLLLAALSLSALQLFSFSASAATPVTATVSAVTVYADRAVVTRRAHVELPAGAGELVFEKLPAALVDASLQVSGRGPARATIVDVSARTTFVDSSPDPREKGFEDALTDLRKQDRVLADQAAALAHQSALLGQIETVALAPASTPGSPAPARLAFDDWQKLMAFSEANAGRLADAQRDLDQRRTKLAAQIAAQEAQLRELRGTRPARKSYKTVTVRLDAAAAGALDLTLTAELPNAGWSPVYDAHLRTAEAKPAVELGYFGLVRNATGEDWGEVALTLSTARPSLGGGSPEPTAWILDVARPVATIGNGSFGGGARQMEQQQAFNNSLAQNATVNNKALISNGGALSNIRVLDNYDAGAPAFGLQGGVTDGWSTAAVDAGVTSATFAVKDPVTLPGDNTPRRVAITTVRLPAQLQYQSVPRKAETAFLSAYITNTTDYPLLTGTLNVFLDENFVAASRLEKTTMPDERFQLALGADEGIAINRTAKPVFSEEVGLSKRHRVTYETTITVTNNKKTPQRVMFKEVVPVSRDEKIKVTLLEPTEKEIVKAEDIIVPNSLPKPGLTREEDGRLVFRADVAPGKAGERKFTVKFTVEYPPDVVVPGL